MSHKTLKEWAEARRCCCRHPDARECARSRSGPPSGDDDEPWLDDDCRCDCLCHDRDEDEEDDR